MLEESLSRDGLLRAVPLFCDVDDVEFVPPMVGAITGIMLPDRDDG